VRTILVLDSRQDYLQTTANSSADAVVLEEECFGPTDPIDQMVIALAQGRPFRSVTLLAALEAVPPRVLPSESASIPPVLTPREWQVAGLLLQGCNDRQIAEHLGVGYTTVRSHGRSLRRKFAVSSRAQVVAKLIHLGMEYRLTAGSHQVPKSWESAE
jgi:DNA-binding NarL/FixJ family response regulator